MNIQSSPIGLKLKKLAKTKKIPVADIATSLSISPQGVYDIFKRKSIGSETLRRICEAIGVNPNEVLSEDSNMEITLKTSNSLIKEVDSLKATIERLELLVAEQSHTIARLAQSNQALIEKLGKFEASGLLAEYDA
jgi:DNA-binding Xre family transcriptional regulator/uncharacterized coiled-coil protein SlyX